MLMVDTDPLAPLQRSVAAILAAGVPGAHLSVRAPDVELDSCEGLAQAFDDDGPCPRPLTMDTAHDLGSVTKVAGTMSMLVALSSLGEVDPEHPVGRYVPEFAQSLHGPDGPATLADLLTHRAGLWEWWPIYLTTATDPLAVVRSLPLRYRPRTARHYSDLGFMILGRVIECIAGQSLPAIHQALVAAPAGTDGLRYAAPPDGLAVAASSTGDLIEQRMIETGLPYPVRDQDYSVTADPSGFDRWRTHVEVGEVNDGNAFHAFGGVAGHAGLFGTVSALHRLGAWWLAGLAGDNSLTAMHRFVVPGPDPGQALGLRTWTSTVRGCSVEAAGHTGFPGIGVAILPEHRMSVALAANRLHIPAGEPIIFEAAWRASLDAAHSAWHTASA
jgi:CubicO group peptidase (beta-lactamase class C family)